MSPHHEHPENPPLFFTDPFTPYDELKLLASLAGVSTDYLCTAVERATHFARAHTTAFHLTDWRTPRTNLEEVSHFLADADTNDDDDFDLETKAHWEESQHPRDQIGRFTDGGGQLLRMAGSASRKKPTTYTDVDLARHQDDAYRHLIGVQSENFFKYPLKHVLQRMPIAATRLAIANVAAGKTEFYRTSAGVVQTMRGKNESNKGTLGYYDPATRKLVLDGDHTQFSRDAVYAHEMGHVLDGPKFTFTKTPAWKEAWQTELKGKRLGEMAARNQQEGFAEFARLCYSGDPHAKLAKDYPLCFSFWQTHNLL